MVDDNHLPHAVLAELNWEPGVIAAHIGVVANDGIVTLTGHVESLAEKHAAEAAARRVKGVKAVAEDIEVRLRPETHRSDEEIAAAVVDRLAWNVSLPPGAINATVEKGWITLTGEVDWHYQKVAAELDVQRLFGVVGVTDEVTIKSKVHPSDIGDDIMHAQYRSWFFDPKTINVSAEDGTVRLTGTVHTAHEPQIAAATAWAAAGVIAVENDITII